ncbi:TPM domain-containing protein [Anaerosalibacter sp. Marseille-P3206]|uniref:TPM domain-containing protein n=1 Tax=Anaerosalibacter sp. Marseille-P3206 TaxID=1871005 RepID=UPI000987AF4E|nr:TPM domain-containing protein [Anaerosalibacter sp. Marseille-P3206]
MKNKIKIKLIPLFIIVFLLFPLVINVAIAASKTKQRIYDFAGLLTDEEIVNLEEMSEKYSSKRNTDIIILTTDDTGGKDVVKYMEDFYDEKALGYDKPHGNCAILTIDMQHREVYVAGFYRGEEYLDNDRCSLVREKITPDLSSGNYHDAFYTFIKTSYKYMGIRPGVNPNNIIFNSWFQIIVSLIVAGISVGIMAFNSGGRITVNEGTYRDFSNSRVIDRRDNYIRTSVTKHRKPSDDNHNSGGSSGGGGGVTSGGHSHSGSRGSF